MGVWRFDLGNLMAHGCGKGKIATIKSRWDRTCGDLTIWAGKSMAPVVSHRGGAWNCSPPQLHCSGRWAVANAAPGRHNGETQRETQQENDVKWGKAEKRPLKEDEIGFVEIWWFDLGNLMAHGCGKGKIATTKSRWDRTCGALSWEIEWRMCAAREE